VGMMMLVFFVVVMLSFMFINVYVSKYVRYGYINNDFDEEL